LRASCARFALYPNMNNTNYSGFPRALPEFLVRLAQNNNRSWFEANKSDYQGLLVEPAFQFINAMAPIVSTFNPALKSEARLNGSFRRLNRDVRFSKDKTPYNPRLHIIFWAGDHPNRSPACHVVLTRQHIGIGAGQWGFDKIQLETYRKCLMDKDKFSQLSKAIKIAAGDRQLLDEPELKRLPKGFQGEGILGDLLRRKGIVVRNQNEAYNPNIFGSNCAAYIEKRLRSGHQVNAWLAQYIV
jgi:uncharacterized protein (TIGR02453 family)